jgi:hypothetical protein
MNASFQRRLLQSAIALGGLVPVLAGLAGVLLGPGLVDPASDATSSLDSHFRYLSGLLFGIGLAFWSLIPQIEKHAKIFQLLTMIVFIGGLSRLYALMNVGAPDVAMQFGLVMELIVTPLLAVWQWKISRA